MAKTYIKYKMVSTASKFTKVFRRNRKNQRTEKLVVKMYDPTVRKHVDFKEEKIK